MARVSEARIEEIRRRIDLQKLVGRRVKLTRGTTEWTGLCPFHKEKSGSFSVYPDHYHCFGCGAHDDAVGWMQKMEGMTFHEAVEYLEGGAQPRGERQLEAPEIVDEAPVTNEQRLVWAEKVWDGVQVIDGTASETYLRQVRAIDWPSWPATLGHHPACEYWHKPEGSKRSVLLGRFPALIAMVETVEGDFSGVWRIFLREDGLGRAAVPIQKRGLGPTNGGAVRLGPAGEDLGIGEGLESAMSAAELSGFVIPFWAGLSTTGIQNLQLPDIVRRPVIFADNDRPQRNPNGTYILRRGARVHPGLWASEAACDRWAGEGRDPTIQLPALPDFNDVLRARKGRLWGDAA